jgi:membrane peptidoglycan carboxypeptidase
VLLVATMPLVGILLVPLLAGTIAATGVIAYEHIAAGLPDLAALTRSSLPQTTRSYDRSGQHLLATLHTQDRDYVSYDQIPATVVAATVAIEDRGFWTNPGIDFGAVVRAALNNAHGNAIQGGSTITQQLVKQLLVGNQETLDRKIREAVFAMKASQVLSKTETMELYLNTVYYGEQAYGIAAAARRYFGEHVDQLDLAQAALLAGLPRAPSELDPFQNPEAAKQRQLAVLDAMLETGVITTQEHDAAAREPWRLQRYVQPAEQIPWFTDRAIEEAAARMGGRDKLASCGCRVITTLDWSLQAIAQRDVTQFITGLPSSDNVHNAALVAEDPSNGEVLAYVGSVDPNDNSPQVRGRFDAAGVGLRSPGST